MLSRRLTLFLLAGVALVGGITALQLTVNRGGPGDSGGSGGGGEARGKFRVGFLPVT